MIDQDFLPIFLDEAIEILEHWESACLKLETESNAEVLGALFRVPITPKALQKRRPRRSTLAHSAEDLITQLKPADKKRLVKSFALLIRSLLRLGGASTFQPRCRDRGRDRRSTSPVNQRR